MIAGWRVFALGIALWAAAPALAQDEGIVLKCSMTLSSNTTSADGGMRQKPNYDTTQFLVRFADQSFQINSADTAKWSDNYCLPVSPMDTETACTLADTSMSARWQERDRQTIRNAQGRWADMTLDIVSHYAITLDDKGVASIQYIRDSKTLDVQYYNLRANGRKDVTDRNGYPDNWAGYTMRITGTGRCTRIG